jgi:membrane dipeptidase
MRRAGLPYAAISSELAGKFQEELVAGAADAYWTQWRRSGVDIASVTLHGEGRDLFSYRGAISALAKWSMRFDRFPDRITKVTSVGTISSVHESGRFGVLFGLQDTSHFGQDLGKLENLYSFGVRIVQLTYNTRNLVGDGCTERNPSGLSHYGVEVVHKLNELGVLVDVSHCSTPTAIDAVRMSKRPIAITHGFAKALHDHDRGQGDEVIRAVGKEGFVGVVLVPFFLTSSPSPSLDDFVRHVEYVANLVGSDHVGIGSDWGGGFPQVVADLIDGQMSDRGFRPEHRMSHSMQIRGFENWGRWPSLTDALLTHGFTPEEVRGMIGGNFLRLLRLVVR